MNSEVDIYVVQLSDVTKHWWQLTLLGIILTALLIGLLYIGAKLSPRIYRYLELQRKNNASKQLESTVRKYFQTLNNIPFAPRASEKCNANKPTSVRIYLGAFDDVDFDTQSRILLDCDLLVLDPLQRGVGDVIASVPRNKLIAQSVLGRLDLEALLGESQNGLDIKDSTILALDCILGLASTYIIPPKEGRCGFTGIVLAGWEKFFSVATLHEVTKELVKRAVDVYLETKPPNFLHEDGAISHDSISGLVIRNCLLWPNGERKDCFDLDNLRPTIKAFMSQKSHRPFVTIMWDEIDDEAVVPIAVLKRTYSWCKYHNTISYVVPSYALFAVNATVPQLEPLSAFDWLKDRNVIELQTRWQNNQTVSSESANRQVFEPISALIPALKTMWSDNNCTSCGKSEESTSGDPKFDSYDAGWIGLNCPNKFDAISISGSGLTYDGKGCFPIGVGITAEDLSQVVQSQKRLRRLELLDEIKPSTLRDIGICLGDFAQSALLNRREVTFQTRAVILELSKILTEVLDCGLNRIRVYQVLDSGLHAIGHNRFWGVYSGRSLCDTDIYISSKSGDMIGTILHTYLSSRGCPRRQCFEAEYALAEWSDSLTGGKKLPKRVQQDIESLSPSENLLLLQQLTLYDSSADSTFLRRVREEIEAQLIRHPTIAQLKKTCTVDYLSGSIDAEELVSSRIDSHCRHNLWHPTKPATLQLFLDVEKSIQEMLRSRETAAIELITATLLQSMKNSRTDTVTDVLTMGMFCAMRKLAFDEVYIEATDRNPLFNDQPDQGAVFAELFALGSRCETYFDMSPSAFGKLVLLKFREQYSNPLHQPPLFKETLTALQTAYAESQTDVALNSTSGKMPVYQRFTFLGVFAIPALIDVLLLTTTKHGLYLSAGMSDSEQKYATIAFMLSLLLSGAIGTWIACGGTYYLASMAFSAMNYFVFTRLIGGFVFLLFSSTIGFIAIGCVNTVQSGLIFFLYFNVLTIYLTLLAALANYNLNGSAFQSGRKIIVMCIPVLFISPLTTIFVDGYDSQIYLTVLYVFVALLLFGTMHIASLWATWFFEIEIIDDESLKVWYLNGNKSSGDVALERLSESAILHQARQNMLREVTNARPSLFKFRSTKDPVVLKLAKCFEATSIMMDWYSGYSGLPKPIPFSSTWNGQSKVALKQLMDAQRGIRFHNAFLHWRQAGDEIGCTILYFIVALLDKWVALVGGRQSINGQETGADLLGLLSTNPEFRYAIGFGLAYYLIGAVLLDYNAQKLSEFAARCKQDIVENDDCLHHAIEAVAHERSALYWKTLRRYLFFHMWSLVIATALMLLFSSSKEAVSLFLAYILAYSGLLLYQYTKTFAGPHALKPLLISVCLGIAVGFCLRSVLPRFKFSDVIALGVGTWTVAFFSLWAIKIVEKCPDEPIKSPPIGYHCFYKPGPDPSWSQSELQLTYSLIRSLADDEHPVLTPESHQGRQIQLLFSTASLENLSGTTKQAFPSATELFESSLRAFNDGKIVVEIFSTKHLNVEGQSIRAISYAANDHVHILVACDTINHSAHINLPKSCLYNIAQIVLHATAESVFSYNHSNASLSENLLKSNVDLEMRMSHLFKCEAKRSTVNDAKFTLNARSYYKQEILRNLCLGFDADLEWNTLPDQIRVHLVRRCIGQPSSLAENQKKYIQLTSNETNFDIHLARCNYGAYMSALFYHDTIFSLSRNSIITPTLSTHGRRKETLPTLLSRPTIPSTLSAPCRAVGYIWHAIGTTVKFFAIALVADAEYQRELKCSLAGNPRILRGVAEVIFDGIWVVAKSTQGILLPYFLFHNRKSVSALWKRVQGREIRLKRKSISIQNSDGQYTGFVHYNDDGSFNLYQYQGVHSSEPVSREKLAYICSYSEKILLLRREVLKGGEIVNVTEYNYWNLDECGRKKLSRPTSTAALPISRRVTAGQDRSQLVNYNERGLIESGSYIKDGNLIRFSYHYRGIGKLDGELLRAEFVLAHMSCTVSWCTPHPEKSNRIDKWMEATFVYGTEVWESKFTYDHKCHPIITTTLNGVLVETPPLIRYDYLNILKKPKSLSFLDDNPLYSFTTVRANPVSLFMGLYTRRYAYLTSQSRNLLWKAWKHECNYDGVVVRWMDERLLRRDKLLKPYWRKRDWGNLSSAEIYLDENVNAIMVRIDLDMTISSWTPLAIKMNDLLTFGSGGDASTHTRSKLASQENENDGALHVIAMDTGTWPNESGGVSACRRDVINNLRSIKWHMVAESANDFGLPIHQIEKNVHSLKIIALWGLDLMTPTHGLFQNRLDSEIKHIERHAYLEDIKDNFVPILTALVWGARSLKFDVSSIKQMTRALVNLNAYFGEGMYPWSMVWNSKVVKNAWRRLWLSKLSNNVRPCSTWLNTELPTLGELDQGLELWSRYLFIFSIPIPEKMPDVFQASHHSASASYGIVCKVKRQCTLQIWDHAISWRETNLYLSSALCPLAPFVRNSLLGLLRVTSVLTLHHADTILPCADFFNPSWEVEIGTCEGSIEHRNTFKRKINPVVNGITDLQRFAPVEDIKSKTPTVTMLSHIWYAKDIKTAILAADIIVNEWGFKDYLLDIYGAVDKAPAYSTNCQEIISSKSLGQNVVLRGQENAIAVLEKTWVFLNSSISEGLPLALGEAALTGAPVVCTDVGASLRVLTDPQTNECYSAIVPPNDARALAKAQIHLLAMMGEWYAFSDRPEKAQNSNTGSSHSLPTISSGFGPRLPTTPEDSIDELVANDLTTLPEVPTKKQVEIITKRMYEQTDARRRLGMRGREIVQKSFSGERYLREHEQMLWIGKAMKDIRHVDISEESLLRELSPELYAENARETSHTHVVMDRRESMPTNTTTYGISSTNHTETPNSPLSGLTSSGSTDLSRPLPSGSTNVTTMFTGSRQSMAEDLPTNRLQWDKLRGQWNVSNLRDVQIV